MNIPIKTNQIEVDLDTSAYNEKFDIFKIETSDKYFSRGAEILDTPLLCNGVKSLYFVSGKCFYVLMTKNSSNKLRLKESLLSTDYGDSITIGDIDASSVNQRVSVSLLLNALSSYELDFLRCSNLTGHLYCFHPSWIRRSGKNSESAIMKIPCLELSITDEMRLTFSVRTFTSELLKSQIVFKKRRFEQYPKYVLAANNALRRKLKADTGKCFILRQTQGDKTDIPFMDIQNVEKFEASKMGVVECVLTLFNEKYKDICNLQFQPIVNYSAVDSSKTLVKENKRVVQSLLEESKVKIVDYIGDAYSSTFCNKVQSILEEKYGITASIGKRISKDSLNLCVIHNAIYYSGNNDPHEKSYDGVAVQHITLEDFIANVDVAITTVIHELLIKRDIEKKQISLFDWQSIGVSSEISFGMRATIQEEDRYFFMTISTDGSIEFKEQKLDLFSINEYTDCINIFSSSKDVVGVIRYADEEINIIRDTNWVTIPEIEKIHKELSSGNTYLRGKEKRRELLSSITDIKAFDVEKSKFYFAGIIGEGMRTGVSDAVNIRKIEPYKNASLRFEELLPLMNVTFVRNGQLTVLPFPFKYLREYIQSLQ